jgi:hypothetical protein
VKPDGRREDGAAKGIAIAIAVGMLVWFALALVLL